MALAQRKGFCDLALAHEWSGTIEVGDRARNAPYAMQPACRESPGAKSSLHEGSRLRGQRNRLFQRRHRQLGIAPRTSRRGLEASEAHPLRYLRRRLRGGTSNQVLDIWT